MSRVWYHRKSGGTGWEEWPEDTLPSYQSCFNVHFLNQFIGWRNYIDLVEKTPNAFISTGATSGYADPIDFLVTGDNIQSSRFWASIMRPLVNHVAIRWTTAEISGDVLSGWETAVDQPLIAEPAAGDILWTRVYLAALRKRYDSAKMLWYRFNTISGVEKEWKYSAVSGSSYTETSGTFGVSTQLGVVYKDSNWLEPDYTKLMAGIYTVVYRTVSMSVPCELDAIGQAIYVTTDQLSGISAALMLDSCPAIYKSVGGYVTYKSSSPSVGVVTLPVLGGTSLYYYTPNVDHRGSAIMHGMYFMVLKDDLPDNFKPAAGFPWEE